MPVGVGVMIVTVVDMAGDMADIIVVGIMVDITPQPHDIMHRLWFIRPLFITDQPLFITDHNLFIIRPPHNLIINPIVREYILILVDFYRNFKNIFSIRI
jgi:hypothetical protein